MYTESLRLNTYLKNLSKMEFVVTDACTGRCKHCSEGERLSSGERIDPALAAEAVKRVAEIYELGTVMAFGGEPLLHTDAVCAIMAAAREMQVTRRQVITNGYFSSDIRRIREVAELMRECGVNDLLLSVDAFHQETIPLGVVRSFALELKRCSVPTRLQPAWLVSSADDNEYNKRTREILDSLSDLEIPESEGNVVFPEGNALRYLSEYFKDVSLENPYVDDPCDVKCLSFSANGDVLGGNIYRENILDIIEKYTPTE